MWESRIVDRAAVDPKTLKAHPHNWRTHPDYQRAALVGVMDAVGWVDDVMVNRRTGNIVDGHLRVTVASDRDEPTVPVTYVDLSEEEEALILATFDPITGLAGMAADHLTQVLAQVQTAPPGTEELIKSLQERVTATVAAVQDLGAGPATVRPSLVDRFVVPPFSVLDARQGYWQDRKRQWLGLGIQSELGRGDDLLNMPPTRLDRGEDGAIQPWRKNTGVLWKSEQSRDLDNYRHKEGSKGAGKGRGLLGLGGVPERQRELQRGGNGRGAARAFGQDLLAGEWGGKPAGEGAEVKRVPGTSVFDPVLCEVAYRWFSPPEGRVLDPFAGGSVRGIVAAALGRQYTGIDLRDEQIDANELQWTQIGPTLSLPGGAPGMAPRPRWIAGDSTAMDTLIPIDVYANARYDLVFTCPPYGDLEQYSDDPADLSTMDYPAFMESFARILLLSAQRLAPDRFAVIVVGDFRDKAGLYRGFVGDTVRAALAAGLTLYNDAILVTAVGSLPFRVGRQFETARKLGKTHQNVLVFVKGDPRAAAAACGSIKVEMPEGYAEAEAELQSPDQVSG